MIRILLGVAMQKEKAHDLSKAISDNPLACAEMPKEDKVPRRPQSFTNA